MLLLAVAALAPIQFHVVASEFANAVYHTACMADRLSCTKPVFSRFWTERLDLTPADRRRFDEFRSVMAKLESGAGEIPGAPFLPNYLSYYPPLRLRARLIAAALGSESAAQFRRSASRIADPTAVDRLARILEAVEQRLHPWWVATGAPIVVGRVKYFEDQIEKMGVPEMARDLAAFLDVNEGASDLYVHTIPSPAFGGNEASSTPNLNHFCVEITHELDAPSAAAGALHEFTHALYEMAPAERKLALMREFVASRDPAAQGLYMYLNEAMATAAQLLVLERNGRKDDDPYNDRYIPRLAYAMVPILRDGLARGATLYDGVAAPYLAAGRKALGADADRLAFQFSSPTMMGRWELTAAYRAATSPRWFATSTDEILRFPNTHAVRVLTFDEAAQFAEQVGGLEDKRGHRGFAWLRSREGAALELFLVGRDRAAIEELAKRTVSWDGAVQPGLLFTID